MAEAVKKVTFGNALDRFAYPIALCHSSGVFIYSNRVWQSRYGYSEDEILGLPPHFLLKKTEKRSAVLSALRKQNGRWAGTQEILLRDGKKSEVYLLIITLQADRKLAPDFTLNLSCKPHEATEALIELAHVLSNFVLRSNLEQQGVAKILPKLSPGNGFRAQQIIKLSQLGYTPKEIAGILNISASTVNVVKWKFRKLTSAQVP